MRHLWPSLLVLAACAAHHPPTAVEGPRPGGSEATPSAVAPDALTPEQVAGAELVRLAQGTPLRRAAVVVLEPRTGKVLALVGFGPEGDRQPLAVVPTGSTLKPFTIAAALESGLDPARRFDGERGRWRLKDSELHDSTPSDWLDATRVVVRSSNVGAAKIAELGTQRLRTLLEQLEFERAPWPTGQAAPLPGPFAWEGEGGLRLAGGGGTTASLLHLTAATATFAQGGVYVRPSADGTGPATRVLSEKSAQSVARMLELAVGEGTGTQARVPGVRVAGKTGTAPTEGSTWGLFIGFAPVANPRWVVGVSVEGPGAGYTGGTVAAPSFARVVAALEAQPRVR